MDNWRGELLPVNPTTERIGNWNLVKYHQRAAGRGRSKTAQGNTFGGGVRHQRTGTAEKLKAGRLAQLVVERNPGRLTQLLGVKNAGAGRTVRRGERRAVSGDRYGFEWVLQKHVNRRRTFEVDRGGLIVGSGYLHPA